MFRLKVCLLDMINYNLKCVYDWFVNKMFSCVEMVNN